MPTNIPLTQDTSNPYSESDIRYNYANPLQIIAAANNNNYSPGYTNTQAQFYSSDGGNTWGQSSLPAVSGDSFQGDPAVEWTSDGTAWAQTLGISATFDLILRSFKSADGGKTWTHDSDVSGTQTAADKPSLWVDHSPTSPNRDNLYVIWHQNAVAWVSVRQGPGGTWSAPQAVSGAETTFTADGGDIKTNADGDVFAFWPNAGGQTVLVKKSTDGGTSFNALGAAPVQIASTNGNFLIDIPAQDERGCLLYISGGAYRTSTLDMVYACWADLAGGAGCNSISDAPGSDVTSTCKTRIFFTYSNNGGTTWQTPVKINDQSSLNDQFFPRLVVDDTTGNLMIVYYDTVDDPGRLKTDIWMQCSVDNGATWSQAVKITSSESDEAASNSDSGNQYGDYIGLTGYGGNFFACWTDSRSGGNEQIWGSAIAIPWSYFVVVKNTYGVDEVKDSPSYANAFYVAVEGASPNSLGTATPNLSGPFNSIPTISPNTSGGPLPFPTYENQSLADTPQRILFPYNVDFSSGANVPPFPPPGPPPTSLPFELDSSIAFQGFNGSNALAAQTLFELVSGADPYFTNIDPNVDNEFYLSQDLRVFTLTPGIPSQNTALPGVMGAPAFVPSIVGGSPVPYTSQDPAAGYNYIQTLLGYLNGKYGDPTPSGTDPFASFPDQGNFLTADSTVNPGTKNPSDPMNPWINYNFAVARVRLTGKTGDSAPNVRVFFRLFITQTYDTGYDTVNTYPSTADAAGWPGSPLPGVGNETYPFFASGDYSPSTITADYGPPSGFNNQNITVGAGDIGGVWQYFGCFLNVYDSSIQGDIMAAGTHQCLVAEIAYDGAPIVNSATITFSPENSDKLAQRNLQISFSDNPGPASTHRIPQSFDTRPSVYADAPDLLMIAWGNTPKGSLARIYWPGVDADEVLQLASRLCAYNALSAADPHTLQCTVTSDVTYVPIPSGSGANFAGLFTVDLPATVVRGQEFSITVRRIGTMRRTDNQFGPQANALSVGIPGSLSWRYIVGTFQVRIPVSTKEVILWPEENTLAILKWRLERMQKSNRWYPVLARYIAIIAGRIWGMGQNPDQIPPSLTGYQPLPVGIGGVKGKRETLIGKVIGIVYDRFGDFEGFRFLTRQGHERSFRGREREVERLVYRAWEEEILLALEVDESDPEWPAAIVYVRP
jgi:hypothetical protein